MPGLTLEQELFLLKEKILLIQDQMRSENDEDVYSLLVEQLYKLYLYKKKIVKRLNILNPFR